jgi:hypothetical protein
MALPRDASPRLVALLSATVGLQMQTLAVNWHVYILLRDSAPALTLFGRTVDLNAGALGLGMLGVARWAPLLLFALAGGLLADTRNRRKLLMATQVAAALLALLLAFLTFSGQVTPFSIYGVVAALVGALAAIISGGLMAAAVALWAGWRDPVLRQYTGEVGEALTGAQAVAV